jgi:signal transduction histidine kinase/ligand-binding sensor domain-containing protein
MSPLRLRGSCFLWVLVEGIFAARVGDSFAASISSNDYVVERIAAVPQMTVRAMVQTRDGYLWLGGYNGLGRFDGVRVRWFTMADTPSLSSDAVSVLCEDRSGNLWIGTDDGGIVRYRDGEFVSFGSQQGLTEVEVRSICEDREGRLWVGTRNGLFYFANERFTAWSGTRLPSETYALAPGPDGSLWIGASGGLFRLMQGSTEALAIVTNGPVPSVAVDPHGATWAMFDSRRNIRIPWQSPRAEPELHGIRYGWFHMGRGGSFLLAGTQGTLSRLTSDGSPAVVARFEKRRFSSLCEDFEGNIWAGVESHGLYRLRQKQVTTHSTADGLPTDSLTTIAEDNTGRIWLGTFGRGLFVSENGSTNFRSVRPPALHTVTAFLERCDRSLWLGTYHGPSYWFMETQFVAQPNIGFGARAIYEDREGALWIGTVRHGVERHRDGQVKRFTTGEGLSSDLVRCLAQDAGGDMWVGTARGLHRISNDKITRFAGEETLARQAILGLYADKRGAVWAGTAGAGLVRYHSNRLQTITVGHGLASDWIEQILEDDDGYLWLGTEAGILRVSRADLEACAEGRTHFVNCLTLGLEEGMIAPRCGSGFKPSCMKSSTGHLWFCTPGGLVVVDPKNVRPRSQPPPVHLESVTGDDRLLKLRAARGSHPAAVVIPPRVTRVGFHYTGLSFSAPDKLRFRYRLEGYDEHWVNAGAAREAVYTRLPAGTYRLRVTATNKDGVANETGATLAVTVVPPWWQSWWFRATAMAGLTGMVFGIYELRVVQHKKARAVQESFARRLIESQEKERKRLAHELHDSLGQSLQVIKGRTQLAARQISNPAQCAQQFEEIDDTVSRAIQEVRAISHALRPAELDQLGLTKAIEWMVENVSVSSTAHFASELENLDGVFSPEMEISLYRIIQEGLNNVVKHAAATEVILELKRESNAVRFSLLDDGRGFLKTNWKSNGGLGLESIAERAKFLGGTFEIQSAPGKGTRLTVLLVVPPRRA